MANDRESGLRGKRNGISLAEMFFECMINADGWMTVQQIAEGTFDEPCSKTTLTQVNNFIRNYYPSAKRPFRLEKIKSGRANIQYRLVKIKGTIAARRHISQHAHELIPLLDQLLRETNKDRVSISFGAVCSLAAQIRQILMIIVAEVPPTNHASSANPKA